MKKPIYKRLYFWVIVIVVLGALASALLPKNETFEPLNDISDSETTAPFSETTTKTPEITTIIWETKPEPPETKPAPVETTTKPPETTTVKPDTTTKPKAPETTTEKSQYADLIGKVVFWAPTGYKTHLNPQCSTFNKEGIYYYGTYEEACTVRTEGWCQRCSKGETDRVFKTNKLATEKAIANARTYQNYLDGE